MRCRHSILARANDTCRRLWLDDSGVVLAVSVLAFLILFIIACSGYAIGETVRQRVELQNAADAAAYSGAVVQADTLSRVAAINRAMSWTYVKLTRMEMDAIVDKWLELVIDKWDWNERDVVMYNAGSCNTIRRIALWNGINAALDKQVTLNNHHRPLVEEIRMARASAAGQQKGYRQLKQKIKQAKKTIEDMNEAEKDLIDQMNDRIKKTVEDVVKANIEATANDQSAGGADISHTCIVGKNYFRVLENTEEDEKRFLTHSGFDQGIKKTFDKGIDDWFVRQPQGGEGIAREYRQQGNRLVAKWDWYSSKWRIVKEVCVLVAQKNGNSEIKGEDGYDSTFYETGTAKPQVLKETFFGKDGAVVVGLKRKLNNPLAYIFSGAQPGVYKAFTVPGGARHMWTASAARAGFIKPGGAPDGEYEVTYEDDSGDLGDKDKMWNLRTSDWDAVLLSLHRAWADGRTGRSWNGETAGKILQEVKGKLGVGGDTAPPGMNGGAFSPNQAEKIILH
ncbi:MAG: pilus assembly protein TadG-related protein [Lentisphaeria bacterium]|nr:pilus assembly protein TadG-related protein [Lentisphaeria bacterium]